MQRRAAIALVLLLAVSCFGQWNFNDPAFVGMASAASGGAPATTNWPYWIVVRPVSSTNTTGNVGTYNTAPLFSCKSNVVYLAGVVHSKASAPNTFICTNGYGQQWTLVGRTNFNTPGTPLEMLEVFSWVTNADMPSDRPGVYATANQTGCLIGVLEVSNVAPVNFIVQSNFNASASPSATPSSTLAALNASGSNAVVAFAGNYTNTANFWQASENRTEDYDLVYSTPSTGFWAGHDTNTTDNTVTITAAAGNWAIAAMELAWVGTAPPGFVVQPVAQSVVTNTTATFTAYAVGGPTSPALTYQWSWGGTNIAGATTTSCTITPTDVSQNGLAVVCGATNAFGGVASSSVTLSVSSGGNLGLIVIGVGQTDIGGNNISIASTNNAPANSTLVATLANANPSAGNWFTNVSSSPSLTWTLRSRYNTNTASTGVSEIWTAPYVAGGAVTVTANATSDGNYFSGVIYAVTNVESSLGGAVATNTSIARMTNSITTTRSGSYIFGVGSDWGANTQATRQFAAPSGMTSTTEILYHTVSGQYTADHWWSVATAAQQYTPVGCTNIYNSSAQESAVLLEIRTP